MSGTDSADRNTSDVKSIERLLQAQTATFRTLIERSERRIYSQLEALIGLYRDLDGEFSLPPLRNWAVSPDTARELVKLIDLRRPGHVVECGAGASTILLGHMVLTDKVQRVTSLEHDPLWFELTRQRLEEAGLESSVDLVFAPLREQTRDDDTFTWYDLGEHQLEGVDLVVVDGPPATSGPNPRRPAARMLLPHCRPGCLFVVDDYIRQEEQDMVSDWLDKHSFRLVRRSESVEKWLAVVEYEPNEPRSSEVPQ